ncbi:hypothetical protein FRC00_006462 [Tulasnella sp. 408]|nr:hypothetical protein FRC00_006462 [Tulasnella sp. 408]
MAHSLSPECTPLKIAYDSCFNAWFEGYLQPAPRGISSQERLKRMELKRKEYDERCGKLWEDYRACLQKAVKDSGLTDMLKEARLENPLTSIPPPDSGKSPA